MTPPHPVLLELIRGGEASPVEDEDRFLSSAFEHRMVASALTAHDKGAVRLSEHAATTLGMWDLAERRRHLHMWETIREVEARLAPLGAKVAVLKGVATEARWYDQLGERSCTDVDLLLEPGALNAGARVVEAVDPARGHSAAIDSMARRRLVQHIDLVVADVAVDLHFDPLKIGLRTRQLDEVWESTQVLETAHGTIRVLRPEIELVLLLLHLNKDRFAYLGPYLDIRQILARGELDWDILRAFVNREGVDVLVWKSLDVVVQALRLQVDVPRVASFRGWTWDRVWGDRRRLQGNEGRQRAPSVQPLVAMHVTGRTGEKARELRRQVLPPRALAELAGQLKPGDSYARYVAIDRYLEPSSSTKEGRRRGGPPGARPTAARHGMSAGTPKADISTDTGAKDGRGHV